MATGNHLRQDILTEKWVIISPGRGQRPLEHQNKAQKKDLPPRDSRCPFCPGNELMIPGIIHQRGEGLSTWTTRVVPNKYPALTMEEDAKGANKGPYLMASADGRHEVIIETPLHNQDIAMMDAEHIREIIETYIQRYNFIYHHSQDISNIIIFRNHGAGSGTSLVHPHSQLIATMVVPKYIYDKERIALKHFRKTDRCSLCHMVEFERSDQERSIYENTSFVAFVPFAAEVPFEVWIVPKRHCESFADINELEKTDMADCMQQVLLAYRQQLGDPDYNFVIHSCSRRQEISEYLHWYLQIQPRMVTRAGFEIGSGIHINPSLPEDDAKILRKQVESQEKYFLESLKK